MTFLFLLAIINKTCRIWKCRKKSSNWSYQSQKWTSISCWKSWTKT